MLVHPAGAGSHVGAVVVVTAAAAACLQLAVERRCSLEVKQVYKFGMQGSGLQEFWASGLLGFVVYRVYGSQLRNRRLSAREMGKPFIGLCICALTANCS